MASTPIAVDQIRADLRAARGRVADLESLLALAERVYGDSHPGTGYEAPVHAPATSAAVESNGVEPALDSTGPGNFLAGMKAKDAMIEMLRLVGRPMPLPDLAELMKANGWRTNAAMPVDTLKNALRTIDKSVVDRASRGRYVYVVPTEQQEDEPTSHQV